MYTKALKIANFAKMKLVQLHQLFGCGNTDVPVRNAVNKLALFLLGTVFTLGPIGEMISYWKEKAISPSSSTRTLNHGTEEIISALKDFYDKQIHEMKADHRNEIQAIKNECSSLKEMLEEKDEFIQIVMKKIERPLKTATTGRKGRENKKEEKAKKESNELAEAKKEIAKLKEDLEQLRREVRAGRMNEKDSRQSRKGPHKVGEENLHPQSRFWAGFATDLNLSEWDVYSLMKRDSTRQNSDTEDHGDDSNSSRTKSKCREVCESETVTRKGNKMQRWIWKMNRKLKRQAKHDPMWDERREELEEWQKLSHSEEILEEEIQDILEDMEQMLRKELERLNKEETGEGEIEEDILEDMEQMLRKELERLNKEETGEGEIEEDILEDMEQMLRKELERLNKEEIGEGEIEEDILEDMEQMLKKEIDEVDMEEIEELLEGDIEEDMLEEIEKLLKEELQDILEDMEEGLEEEEEVLKEDDPEEIFEDTEILEAIREILQEEKAQMHSKRRWGKNAWKSIIREHKERKADKRAEKKLRKQQLISTKRKEERKTQREAENRWVSRVKRNIMHRHEERKHQRKSGKGMGLWSLIVLAKLKRKLMKANRMADQALIQREAMSLALEDYKFRIAERERRKEAKRFLKEQKERRAQSKARKDRLEKEMRFKRKQEHKKRKALEREMRKEAKRAFKEEEKERKAQIKAEKDRMRNEWRYKIQQERKKRRALESLEIQRINRELQEMVRRKKDLDMYKLPLNSLEALILEYIWFFLEEPALISLYLRHPTDPNYILNVLEERWKNRKKDRKTTRS
ncbi:trichohyalin-like [Macrobrachium nipponense]|uniref:trichohyalin-like n=1 Tax=Macrobrachium nipponense TaxID=159736 RepID=UPI0030C868C4